MGYQQACERKVHNSLDSGRGIVYKQHPSAYFGGRKTFTGLRGTGALGALVRGAADMVLQTFDRELLTNRLSANRVHSDVG